MKRGEAGWPGKERRSGGRDGDGQEGRRWEGPGPRLRTLGPEAASLAAPPPLEDRPSIEGVPPPAAAPATFGPNSRGTPRVVSHHPESPGEAAGPGKRCGAPDLETAAHPSGPHAVTVLRFRALPPLARSRISGIRPGPVAVAGGLAEPPPAGDSVVTQNLAVVITWCAR